MTEDEKRGKLLSELRKKKGLTQQDLAELIHYSDKNISKWECGKSFPTNPNVINELAKIFDVSLEEIVYGELKEKGNTKAMENSLINTFLKSYNKHIKIIKNISFILLLFIIISLLAIYFIYVKNSIKLYVSEISSNNIKENKVSVLLTNKKNFLVFNPLVSKQKEISQITFYYKNHDKKEIIFISGNENNYVEDNYGYDEYHLKEFVKNDSYIKIEYTDSTYEEIQLNFKLDYKNDTIFPNQTERISTKSRKTNEDKIEETLRLNGFEKEEQYLTKYINETTKYLYIPYSNSMKIYITQDNILESLNSTFFSNEVIYEKTVSGKSIDTKTYKIKESKNCDKEKCLSIQDYIMYINYLKKELKPFYE